MTGVLQQQTAQLVSACTHSIHQASEAREKREGGVDGKIIGDITSSIITISRHYVTNMRREPDIQLDIEIHVTTELLTQPDNTSPYLDHKNNIKGDPAF